MPPKQLPLNFSDSFWQAELAALNETIDPLLIRVLLAGIDEGVKQLPAAMRLLVDWDVVNEAALNFARNYTYDTVAGITRTSQRQTAQAIANWIESGQPLDSLSNQLAMVFGPQRGEMIAATEVTRAYASGNMLAWTGSGLVGAKRWMSAVDERVCPICGPLHNTVVEIDQPWQFTQEFLAANPAVARALKQAGNNIFMPPSHPRCRCFLQPVIIEAYEPEDLAGQLFRNVQARSLVNAN